MAYLTVETRGQVHKYQARMRHLGRECAAVLWRLSKGPDVRLKLSDPEADMPEEIVKRVGEKGQFVASHLANPELVAKVRSLVIFRFHSLMREHPRLFKPAAGGEASK
jgi:hypothetical protein